MSILELKAKYLEELGDKAEGLSVEKLRYFCLGKELKDELKLHSYDLKDGLTIQCMIR